MAQANNVVPFSNSFKPQSLKDELSPAGNKPWKIPSIPDQDSNLNSNLPAKLNPLEALSQTALAFQLLPQKEPRGLMGAYYQTCRRWNLGLPQTYTLLGYRAEFGPFMGSLMSTFSPPMTQDIVDRIGYVLTISFGLGALFDESQQAELNWLQTPKKELGEEAPLTHMLKGRVANLISVARLVEMERGL